MATLVELCAGSAALTRALFGVGPIVGYMGGKDRYAAAIWQAWLSGQPANVKRIVLNDPGLWGLIWQGVVADPQGVSAELEACASVDARQLFNAIPAALATGPTQECAAALALLKIAGTYGGGEIGGFKGRHIRRPKVDGFIPNRLTLAKRVAALRFPVDVRVTKHDIAHVPFKCSRNSLVYIDPPYQGVSGYVHVLPREQVVALAVSCYDAGAAVAVSEHIPLPELLVRGWVGHEIEASGGQGRRNTRSTQEWLTVSPNSPGAAR